MVRPYILIAIIIMPAILLNHVIRYNKKRFESPSITFTTKDIRYDHLPSGDVAFLRQVLQHCSN